VLSAKVKIGELLLREGIIDPKQLDEALLEHKRSGLLMGKVLVKLGMVSEELLVATINKQLKSRDSRRLGEVVVEDGYITKEQLAQALDMSKTTGQKLGMVLVRKGFLNEDALMEILAARMEIPSAKLADFDFSPEILKILPEEVCQQLRLIPMEKIGNKLNIAMIDPSDLKAVDIVQFKTGCDITAFMATEKDVLESIERVYRKREPFSRVSKDSLVTSIEKMCEAQKLLVEMHEKSLIQQRIVLSSLQEMLLVARQKK